MTDHAEEQEMEAEAMAAIFDSHFEAVSPSSWKVSVYPEHSSDPDELQELNHVGIQLNVSLPETYPEVLPSLSVQILKGLADEPHRTTLEGLAQEEAEANIGVPSIFAVTERLREWLVENNVPGLDDISMHAQMLRKQKEQTDQKQQQEIQFESHTVQHQFTEAEKEELGVRKRRAEGTPCNKENFDAWNAKYMAEMVSQAQDEAAELAKTSKKKEKVVDKSGRLTGYQQFSGKIGNLEALEAAAQEAEAAEYDEELFDDDVDLDDLDFDDDDDDDDEEEEELDI